LEARIEKLAWWYVEERDYTNDSQDELEIDGHCYRRTLQMTSNKEILRILEIKEDSDEIIQHLTHSLEIYGRWENTSGSTSEKTGRIQRRTLQMTSNKEIQRDLEIKDDGDEIKQHLTH
jgi:hypothetical protein